MAINLKNKKVLITAGPTWVAVDKARVISNIATGETGILLAKEAIKQGAKVTLALGPANGCSLDKAIKVRRFRFFDELKNIIVKELKTRKYDIVIHSAAVSDYRPEKEYHGKVKSGIKNWKLNLVPTEKIINLIKKADKNIFLAGFKFNPALNKGQLINHAMALLKHCGADLVVANRRDPYQAFIINKKGITAIAESKRDLVNKLLKTITPDTYNLML